MKKSVRLAQDFDAIHKFLEEKWTNSLAALCLPKRRSDQFFLASDSGEYVKNLPDAQINRVQLSHISNVLASVNRRPSLNKRKAKPQSLLREARIRWALDSRF